MLQSSYTQLEPKFQFTGSQPTETNYTNPYVLLFRGNAKYIGKKEFVTILLGGQPQRTKRKELSVHPRSGGEWLVGQELQLMPKGRPRL